MFTAPAVRPGLLLHLVVFCGVERVVGSKTSFVNKGWRPGTASVILHSVKVACVSLFVRFLWFFMVRVRQEWEGVTLVSTGVCDSCVSWGGSPYHTDARWECTVVDTINRRGIVFLVK